MKLLLLLLLAGCSSTGGGGNTPPMDLSQPPTAGWSLTGTLSGFTLQTEAISAEAHPVGATNVLVQISSRAKVCDLLQQNDCPNGRILGFRIGGNDTGTFSVADKNQPGAGEAHLFFLDLDAQCGQISRVNATSGTLTVTSATLGSTGLYSFSFDADTAEGPISGQVRAPFCQM